MKNNVLHDLYNGHINPAERKPNRTNEIRALSRKIEVEKSYFAQKMSLDDFQRLQALEHLYGEESEFEQIEAFAYGFRLGTMLMCGVFGDGLRCE